MNWNHDICGSAAVSEAGTVYMVREGINRWTAHWRKDENSDWALLPGRPALSREDAMRRCEAYAKKGAK